MSNKTINYYRYEANDTLLSSVVIALYNEYKKPSNDFDKFSNDLLTNNIFNQSIPIIDVFLFINYLNEKNMPSVLKKHFDNIEDFISSKVDLIKLFNDCIEANLHQIPSVESYSIKQVASLLNVNTQTITSLIKNGEINSFLVGSRYRILARDINYFIQKNKRRSSTPLKKIHENTTQKPLINQKEEKIENTPKTLQKPQNQPQKQHQKEKQTPQFSKTKPNFKEKRTTPSSSFEKKSQSSSTLPYHTLPYPNDKLKEVKPKNTVKKTEIIEENKDKEAELANTLPEITMGKEIDDNLEVVDSSDVLENVEKTEDNKSVENIEVKEDNITEKENVVDNKDNNDDIFGEIKSKEELSSQNISLPNITLSNEQEKIEDKLEENKTNESINDSKDFILITNEKEEVDDNTKFNVSDINESNLEKDDESTSDNTLSYPTLVNNEEKQKSDIINLDEQKTNENENPKNKKLKINYPNK